MPRKGFKSVTISEEIYNLIKEQLKKYGKQLRLRRVRTISDFVEDAVLYYIKTVVKKIEEGKEEEIL